jgi:hypothetical protein
VLLNAGSTGGRKVEWNVLLDPLAYVGLLRSDLPIRWYPPGTDSGAFDPADERGTYYRARQADLFRDLPSALRRYFTDALAGAVPAGSSPHRGVTGDDLRWRTILSQDRNLWSTASLVMGARRVLARTEAGWRFLPVGAPGNDETWPWRLDPIRMSVDDEGRVDWAVVEGDTGRWIFGRQPGRGFGPAMTEALDALLREMKVRQPT